MKQQKVLGLLLASLVLAGGITAFRLKDSSNPK